MLYIVATPIGNLGEITFRAVEVLTACDAVLCEDTRRTAILLNHYKIKKPLISLERFSESKKIPAVLGLLSEGKNVCLVSDAGMPLISDPGSGLLAAVREAGHGYTVISGACALVNAAVLSGFNVRQFCFLGFLPSKNTDRKDLIAHYKDIPAPLIFYVAPHDLIENISFLNSQLGNRRACLVREISKIFEEAVEFSLDNPPEFVIKGEMTLVVDGANLGEKYADLTLLQRFEQLIAAGFLQNDALKQIAKERGVAKSVVYKEVLLANKK